MQIATDIAGFVTKNQLDGVDVNYEDLDAMTAGTAEAWVIGQWICLATFPQEGGRADPTEFQTTLRKLLPKPYLISHAPIAPWFRSPAAPTYPKGGYLGIDEAVGEGIDWYNIQYYNQKADNLNANYMDCAVSPVAGGLCGHVYDEVSS